VIRFLVCLACLLLICPTAFAQGEDTEWASGSGGHFALLAKDQAGVPLLWLFGPGGERSAPEAVAEGSTDPIAAVGRRGDALVVYYDDDERLFARYRPVGGTLGPPEALGVTVDFGAEAVVAGLDGSGTATVTWSPASGDETGGMWVRTRSEAGVWSAPQNLGGYRAFAPSLAVTPNGSAVLVWRQSTASDRDEVAIAERPSGGTFGRPRVLRAARYKPHVPTAAANDRGDAVVIWSQEGKHNNFDVWAAFRGPGTGFGAPAKLNHERDMVSRWLTVLPDGRSLFGWTNNLTRRVEARVRTAEGRLGPPQVLTRDLEVNSDLYPLAYGAGGIAWADRDPGVSMLRYALSDGDRFLPPRDIVKVHGWTFGAAFAAWPGGVAVVPRLPLHAESKFRWQRVLPE
jgi:hypothetical protein